MTNEEIIIEMIIRKFVTIYNQKYCQDSEIKENRNILGDGYCLFLAMFLKKIFPEGQIINTRISTIHIIFYYKENYYDYRGKILALGDYIQVLPDIYTPIKDLYVMESIDVDYYLDCFCDQNYYRIWCEIEPELEAYAQKLLNKAESFQR